MVAWCGCVAVRHSICLYLRTQSFWGLEIQRGIGKVEKYKNQDSSLLKAMKHTFYAWRVLPAGRCAAPFLSQYKLEKKIEPNISKNSLLTLMCCDGCSPFPRLGLGLRSNIPSQLSMCLGAFMSRCHAFHAFTNVCIVAPVSRFFMLRLCHSRMSVHRFQQKRKKKKKKGGKKMRGEAERG